MTELLIEQASAFGHGYPDIPHRSDFTIDESDNDPVFMTLPIGAIDITSKNGRHYDEAFYQELVRQVNERPDPLMGNVGHENPDSRAWEIKLPSMEWVGATLDIETGIAWAKAYILPEDTKLRQHIRRAKRRKQRVATSIWGEATMDGDRATKPTFKGIDFASPDKAGVEAAIAIPEMIESIKSEDTIMSDDNKQELVIELRTDRDGLRTQVAELTQQVAQYEPAFTLVAELRTTLDNEDLRTAISELQTELTNLRTQTARQTITELVNTEVKLETARPIILSMLGEHSDPTTAKERLGELLKAPHVIEMQKALALSASGGRALVGEHNPDAIDTSQEALAAAHAETGL